jgi:hypothetical protein
MPLTRDTLEQQLNHMNTATRRDALDALLDLVAHGDIVFPEPKPVVNLHCHTFFSFNGYGFSPTYLAWKSRCDGLLAAGIVDFDVLDAVDEFLAAARKVGLRACAGIETRVFVPQFETRVINSPGEPGVSYHMGTGFTSCNVPDTDLLAELKEIAQGRNRGILERVNPFLAPVSVNYEDDVLPLTPNGNATERHICMAFDNKAKEAFPEAGPRAAYWTHKLDKDTADLAAILDDGPTLQGLIRAKTMKAGGVGYVQPSGPDFPTMERINQFTLACGGLPVFAWLDGTTEGETAIEELFDLHLSLGAAAVNVIPDRNWNIKDPDTRAKKSAKLHEFVALARERNLPVLAGTEMNAYGQPFVDNFGAPEMQPLADAFIEGAQILYAHTILQGMAGMGYLSEWARSRFDSTKAKNAFFRQLGEALPPSQQERLANITSAHAPQQILAAARGE